MELSINNLKEIIANVDCGIIIMDQNRKIFYLNLKADEMTGWKIGDTVPFCEYCQKRKVELESERCLLSVENPVKFFNSNMAVYSDNKREFKMTLKNITINGEKFRMLNIKCPKESNWEEEEFHELLVQETMLAQEVERRRIARELHDHIGQNIYSIFLGLEGMKYLIKDKDFEAHFNKMTKVMDTTIDNIKRLTKSLRPENIQHLGIEAALREAKDDWQKLYNIKINLELDFPNVAKFNEDYELHIFRIVQEAIVNAVRHGYASEISIDLQIFAKSCFFKITDNGKGFYKGYNESSGLGIKHMYERVKMMDGSIKLLRSKCDKYTVVEGFIPNMLKGEG